MSPNLIWAALQKSYYMRIEEARQKFQTMLFFWTPEGSTVPLVGCDRLVKHAVKLDFDLQTLHQEIKLNTDDE